MLEKGRGIMKRENTKKQFLIEALKLFAEFGYDSVSISQIAERVGCSAPALYKHYSGKQALFDAIIELSELSYEERMKSIHHSFWNNEKSDYFLTEKGQMEFVVKLFDSAISEEYPRLFRNFIISEKSKNPELSKIYNERYIFSQYGFFEEIIKELIARDILNDENSEIMAIEYASPVALWIEACDREPERKEEFLKMIKNHIHHFFRVYRKNS
ncbi:MAG: TetR/AcrR family transcriptional regulator [Oscillospiraceae bacterium]|nr:TetR/AcrR family transcriptional regulator [Oscillospiraceae bacterium]